MLIDAETLRRVLDRSLRPGGEFSEVFVEDRRSSAAALDDGRVEELMSGLDRGAGIRVVVGETTGFAHTADLTEAGLMKAAEAAAAAARGGGGGTRQVALGPAGGGGRRAAILPADVPKARKVELLQAADAAARGAGGAIKQVSAADGDARRPRSEDLDQMSVYCRCGAAAAAHLLRGLRTFSRSSAPSVRRQRAPGWAGGPR